MRFEVLLLERLVQPRRVLEQVAEEVVQAGAREGHFEPSGMPEQERAQPWRLELRRDPAAKPYAVTVSRAEGEKCDRCWRIVATRNPDGICERCQDALMQTAPS